MPTRASLDAQRHEPAATAATGRTGIERMMAEEGTDNSGSTFTPLPKNSLAASSDTELADTEVTHIEVTERADTEHKAKTTLPKIAGSYKLPPSSLLHRPDEQQSVHEEELKAIAQVLDREVRGV